MVATTAPLVATTWISQVRAASSPSSANSATTQVGPYCTGPTVLAPFDFAADRLRRLTETEAAA